jgi:DNA-directed RNA polymerase subunit RPC12/RpoP
VSTPKSDQTFRPRNQRTGYHQADTPFSLAVLALLCTLPAMARSRCKCGSQILWKADERDSDEWYLIRASRVPVDVSAVPGIAEHAAVCSTCGRIWVAWHGSNAPTEYAPVNPA